jgi:hypothetical protein
VIKVFLLSTFRRPEQDTHWASPYFALWKAFTETCSPDWQLVDTPEAADLILVCPRARNPLFPVEVFRNGIAWKYRHKCVVISTDDDPTLTHKGFYTSLRAGATRSPWLKGGFYPLVTYSSPDEAFPTDLDFRYLFSFLGSFDTHPVRRRIGALARGTWSNTSAEFLVRDTSKDNNQLPYAGTGRAEFRQQYLAALRDSKFVLCPRGMCPTSVRLFETMKVCRVPVVISDEWVRPPDIPWDQFAIVIKEKDTQHIPEILQLENSSFAERAKAARQAWESRFAPDVLANTVSRWGMGLVEQAARDRGTIRHLADLLFQTARWRFIRRGLMSELKRTTLYRPQA